MEKYSIYILFIPMTFFLLSISFFHHAITLKNPWLKFGVIIFMLLCLAFCIVLLIRYSNDFSGQIVHGG